MKKSRFREELTKHRRAIYDVKRPIKVVEEPRLRHSRISRRQVAKKPS